jgi:hypothetical protein
MFKIRISLLNPIRFSKISRYTPLVSKYSVSEKKIHANVPLIEFVGQMSHLAVTIQKEKLWVIITQKNDHSANCENTVNDKRKRF